MFRNWRTVATITARQVRNVMTRMRNAPMTAMMPMMGIMIAIPAKKPAAPTPRKMNDWPATVTTGKSNDHIMPRKVLAAAPATVAVPAAASAASERKLTASCLAFFASFRSLSLARRKDTRK